MYLFPIEQRAATNLSHGVLGRTFFQPALAHRGDRLLHREDVDGPNQILACLEVPVKCRSTDSGNLRDLLHAASKTLCQHGQGLLENASLRGPQSRRGQLI